MLQIYANSFLAATRMNDRTVTPVFERRIFSSRPEGLVQADKRKRR